MNEFQRRKIPTGGTGGGPAAGGGNAGGKTDPVAEVERLYPDQAQYWNRMGYSKAEREAEAPFVLRRRAMRTRTA